MQPPQTSTLATRADRGKSWMLPEAKGQDLLYVTGGIGVSANTVALTYPSGERVGVLYGVGGSTLCADTKGDVFVLDFGPKEVLEYAHGGTQPIATLTDPGYPNGCSVDPITGDLAVANASATSGSTGNVAIFKHARGPAETHSVKDVTFLFCGYDDRGNLFADGDINPNQPNPFRLVELPKRSAKLLSISLSGIPYPGHVQWDGTYITIGDSKIRRVKITGSSGTIVQTIRLEGWKGIQSWIQGDRIVLPSGYGSNSRVGLFRYPGGGHPISVFEHFGERADLIGSTVSLAN